MLEHRPVDLLQHVEAHRDLEVGRDADNVGVERSVMQLAEREAVDRSDPAEASRSLCGDRSLPFASGWRSSLAAPSPNHVATNPCRS